MMTGFLVGPQAPTARLYSQEIKLSSTLPLHHSTQSELLVGESPSTGGRGYLQVAQAELYSILSA